MLTVTGLDWDELTAWEVMNKGWYGQARIQMDNGRVIPLNIWDPIRLQQELESDFSAGKRYFAEENLIVVPKLTKEAIMHAVEELFARGFFS